MKQTLVIGSTVVDVVIHIDVLPGRAEDIHISDQFMILGGCAFNVSNKIRQAEVPLTLCSPVGTGVYGDFVKKELFNRNIPVFVNLVDRDNGCCYCLIDKTGERTFMSLHGAEYLFRPEWMISVDMATVDSIYICGLEVEEPTGDALVAWLETQKCFDFTLYFAPGPRISCIPKDRINRIFALHPILHMNEEESLCFTNSTSLEQATEKLYSSTDNTVIVTLGSKGVFCKEKGGKTFTVDAIPVTVQTTNGAGDAHMGAFIASIKKGLSVKEALLNANCVASAVVSATATDD